MAPEADVYIFVYFRLLRTQHCGLLFNGTVVYHAKTGRTKSAVMADAGPTLFILPGKEFTIRERFCEVC